MKSNKKKFDIWEGLNPSLISELIDNESKNPNVPLILIKSSIRIQNFTFANGENRRFRRTDR
jgi:hypothetical protein